MTPGISIVVCSHNGAARLVDTLGRIAALDPPPAGLPWEVIVIDNDSKDETAEVARRFGAEQSPVPFALIHEPTLGLSFARRAGLDAARYEWVSFVDDDNWVAQDWLTAISIVMHTHPETGACGGWVKAVWEREPPPWLKHLKHHFAIGKQAHDAGDVCDTVGYLWGAGLTVRKTAWHAALARGFVPLATGRRGQELRAGDDEELCYALRITGWGLRYDPRIQLEHFIPAHRMSWEYMRRLHRGFGAASAMLEPYRLARERPIERVPHYGGVFWVRWMLQTLREVLFLSRQLPPWQRTVGDPKVLKLDNRYGRLMQLLKLRGQYDENLRYVYQITPPRSNRVRNMNAGQCDNDLLPRQV
jgi:GT2 family glycosyltransferase